MQVKGKAPTRVDLAGGTLDLWPVYNLLHEKATINVGVDLPAEVTVITVDDGAFRFASKDLDKSFVGDWQTTIAGTELPLLDQTVAAVWSKDLPALSIETSAKSPAGAGLGGSSCLALTLVSCLDRLKAKLTDCTPMEEWRLVATAQNIESKLINAPTGCQDYWGAARGGLNVISFPATGELCTTYPLQDIQKLSEKLMLVFSGKSRASAINNWEIFKRVFDGDKALLAKLDEIGALAHACGIAARAGDWDEALRLSAQEWQCRTQLWPAVETVETKAIDAAAKKAGASLTRVCGAGGGGVMAVIAEPATHADVKTAVEAAGGKVLDTGIANYGISTEIL